MIKINSIYPFYREVQYLRQVWLWALILFISLLALFGAVQQLILGRPFGDNPAPDVVVLIIAIIFGFGFPVFPYRTNLATEVRSDGLYFRYFPFHLSFHKIAAEDIKKFEARTYSPIREYGGWGIRYGRKGKAYNVSGNRGVQLELSNGQQVLFGSQSPEELAEALSLALGKRAS